MWDVIDKRNKRLIGAFESWEAAYKFAHSTPTWKISPTEYRERMNLRLPCSLIQPDSHEQDEVAHAPD